MEFLSSIFHPIVELMTTLVTYAFQLTQMVGYPSYGVAIILLTIVIKAVLAPLTVKQIKSMKAMQELQPRMKELQDKYKNDPDISSGSPVRSTTVQIHPRKYFERLNSKESWGKPVAALLGACAKYGYTKLK